MIWVAIVTVCLVGGTCSQSERQFASQEHCRTFADKTVHRIVKEKPAGLAIVMAVCQHAIAS